MKIKKYKITIMILRVANKFLWNIYFFKTQNKSKVKPMKNDFTKL
jgi:hypothetical protein